MAVSRPDVSGSGFARSVAADQSQGLLLVEDDLALASILRQSLTETRCEIVHADTLWRARQELQRRSWNLVLLDAQLPDGDGFQLCRELRECKSRTAVMMLTARSSEADRITGLEIGADDYLTKPFSLRELLLRANNLLRRSIDMRRACADAPYIRCGDLVVDIEHQRVHCRGTELSLTPREFELLAYMARRTDRVFTRTQLLDAVWGAAFEGFDHTVNTHINRLRSKIEVDPRRPRQLVTVWGRGYRLIAVPADATESP